MEGACSYEIKRHLLLRGKAMTILVCAKSLQLCPTLGYILFNVSLCVFVFFMDFMYLCVLYVFYVSVYIFFYMCIHLLIFYFLLTGNRTAI